MNKQPSLYDITNLSYKNKNEQAKGLNKFGYQYDSKLSNDNEQVYYNPTSKKLIYNVSGTHNLKDWGTDAYLLAGHLKDTNRYKEASQQLKAAKLKYGTNAQITGHSLGGSIASYIGSRNDNVKTLDKGSTFFQKTRPNERSFRSAGDVVSLLNANSKRTTTIKNSNKFQIFNPVANVLNSHKISNIKNEKIFF